MILLIEEGNANVQIRHAQTGKVPLHEAAQNGHLDCIKVNHKNKFTCKKIAEK